MSLCEPNHWPLLREGLKDGRFTDVRRIHGSARRRHRADRCKRAEYARLGHVRAGMVLTHFSGGMVASLGPDTEGSLWQAYSDARNAPNTPAGRQAFADTGRRTVAGRGERPAGPRGRATRSADYERQWWEAERDRILDDPALKSMIEGGDPAVVDAIRAELGRMVEAAQRVEQSGGEGIAIQEVVDLAGAYGRNPVDYLRNDPAFQQRLHSGLASDLDDIADLLGAITGLARQLEIMGDEEDAGSFSQAWLEWFRAMSASIGATCAEAPIDSRSALRFARQAALAVARISSAASSGCGPPGFVGEATYTSSMSQSEAGLMDSIAVRATNVIWEPEGAPGAATTYHAVAGRLTFAEEGVDGECTMEAHGSATIAAASAATDSFLFVDLTGPTASYSGFARLPIPVTTSTTCGNDTFPLDTVTSVTWLNTETVPVETTGGALVLQGSRTNESAGSGETWTWDFAPR